MVFESVVTDVLNKILGDYIENLDKNQLKIGIWGGDVVLNNLKLRENALDDLNLPVQLVYGYLGKLVLKIPWKNLYSQRVVAEIEDFYILISPKQSVPYDAEKEEKYDLQAKQSALFKLDEARQKELDKDKPKPDATFAEKLTAQIVNNLQVKIANVHLRYEDTTTTGSPFSFGVTLHELEICTTDLNWDKCYIAEQVSRVYKLANLDSLSVYMNCNALLFSSHNTDEFTELFRKNIAHKENVPPRYHYIVGPISSLAKLQLNMNPEYDDPPFVIPKIDLSLELEKLNVGLTSTQFQDIIKLADLMNRLQLGAPYREYRPFNTPYKGHYKEWWRFAITAVLEVDVRKKARSWSWEHIKEHRQQCRQYAAVFKEKKLTKKPTANLTQTCTLLEQKLDIFNLLLIRQRVQLDLDKLKREEEQKTTQKAGWFGGWFGGGQKQDYEQPNDLVKKLEAAMNSDEKEKLYQAIGYQENAVPLDVPEHYEAINMNFKLIALEVGLYDDSNEQPAMDSVFDLNTLQTIMLLKFSMATCSVKQRPAANAISVTATMKEMKLTGIKSIKDAPTIIESKVSDELNLLNIFFETNPLDKRCDQRINVVARPLQITYDSDTVLHLIKVFSPPKTVNLSEIEGAASARMANFKERSATGMQYVIETHSVIEVDILLMPNILILPRTGTYVSAENSVVVVSLGQLHVTSAPHKQMSTNVTTLFEAGHQQDQILQALMDRAYDKFKISIADIQILVAKPHEKWENVLRDAIISEMHLLRPTSIIIEADICVVDDDPRLPKTKVEILLPSVRLAMTEERIFEALNVATSIPLPENEIEPAPLLRAVSTASRLSLASFLNQEKRRVTGSKSTTQSDSSLLTTEIVQYTSLELNFALKEFGITLFKSYSQPAMPPADGSELTPNDSMDFSTPIEEMPSAEGVTFEEFVEPTADETLLINDAPPGVVQKLLSLKILQLEAHMAQRTYELVASAKLGAINLTQYGTPAECLKSTVQIDNETKISIIDTPRFSAEQKYLLTIAYTMANKCAPEFTTKYNSTEQLIVVNFSTLNVTLHQEYLLHLLEITNVLQSKLDAIIKSAAASKDRVGTAGSPADETIVGGLQKLAAIMEEETEVGNMLIAPTADSRKKRKCKRVESIKISVIANLEQVSLLLTCRQRELASLTIEQFNAGVILKSSYTEINLQLKDMRVLDLNPLNRHSSILSIVGKNALTCQVVLYNVDETANYNSDDMKITVEIGCMKIVFLNWFVTSVLRFLDNFQAAQQALANASAAAADAAKQNALDAYEKEKRMKLDLRIKAPIIVVPVDSQSFDAMALDLGFMHLSNTISELQVPGHETAAVLDEIKLELKDVKLSKVVIINDKEEQNLQLLKSLDTTDCAFDFKSDFNILDPISFNVCVKRNLSSVWYHDVPEIDVSGRLKPIEVNLLMDDYAMIMSILERNLNEGINEFPPVETVRAVPPPVATAVVHETADSRPSSASVSPAKRRTTTAKVMSVKPHKKIYEQLKFNFQFDGVVANLLLAPHDGLARFGLYFLSLKGTKLIDGTLSTSIVLCNIQIDDTRRNTKSKITKYLCRKDWKHTAAATNLPSVSMANYPEVVERNFMLDVTAIIKDNDTFAEVRVCGFDLILCIDFLLKLAEFFTMPGQVEPAAQASLDSSKFEAKSAARPGPCTTAAPEEKKMNLMLHIEEPDIILIETLEDINTNAIIFNAEAQLNYRAFGERQLINGQIDALKMYMCSFMPERREATKHYIIHPCVISLQGSTPEESGLHISLKLSEIIINVSPATIELFNKAMLTINAGTLEKAAEQKRDADYTGIWSAQKFNERDHWFVRTDVATDALALLSDDPCPPKHKTEKCVVEVPCITVVVEMGIGYYTTPLISIDTRLDAVVSNWSNSLSVSGSLSLNMNYYNQALAAWEPIIELNERITREDVQEYLPWQLHFSLAMESIQNELNDDDDENAEQKATKIQIKSEENIELTLSKTCLDLLGVLGEAFSQAIDAKGLVKPEVIAPYVIENDTGFEIKLNFRKGIFTLHECHMPQTSATAHTLNRALVFQTKDETKAECTPEEVMDCTISPGGRAYLQTKVLSNVTSEEDEEYNLYVHIGEIEKEIILPVSKSDKRYFPLMRDTFQDPWGIISEVRSEFGTTKLNIHGVVNVRNHFTMAVQIYRNKPRSYDKILIGEVAPGETFHVPLHGIYVENKDLFFALNGYKVSVQGFRWNENPSDLKYTRQLQCDPIDTYESFYINVVRQKTEVFFENTNKFKLLSAYYTIHLRPPLYLRNALPISVTVSVAGCSVQYDEAHKPATPIINDAALEKEELLDYGEKEVKPGDVLHLPTVKLSGKTNESRSFLVVRLIQYLEKDWSCTTELKEHHDYEVSVWNFCSYDSAAKMEMDLCVRFDDRYGSLVCSIFSPFWLINKTGLMLSYKTDTDNVDVLYHPPEYDGPILFSFREKLFFEKKRAQIRVENGAWSDKIPLDVAGSIGAVTCKDDDVPYMIGVHNHLTHNSLTKQITFIPFYIATNKCEFPIELQEQTRPGDPWIRIEPDACVPLWPKNDSDNMIVARVEQQCSVPFNYSEVQCTLLKLEQNKYGGINVDVQATEGGVYINFTVYNPGDAPGLLINHTSKPIKYREKGTSTESVLRPHEKILYTWADPAGDKELVVGKNKVASDLRRDGVGELILSESKGAYWVSFLDGLQRVLLFTDDESIAKKSESSATLQMVTQSIEVRIHGIGLSVLNNETGVVIMYLGITHSGVIWESKKPNKKRFKRMKIEETALLETSYQQYLINKSVNIQQTYVLQGKHTIDFDNMILNKGTPRAIQRTFYPGVWIQMNTSPFQTQLHAKINKIQLDNQLTDCIFPVVLAPIAPPKSVATTTALKPFIECSMVQRVVPHSTVKQFKYARMLIQEFHFKVDLIFLTAIANMFAGTVTDKQAAKLFNIDVESITRPLSQLVETQALQEQKNFYDNLHLGPLKIHVSFSMAGSDTTALPGILSTLIQGVGVTLTDVHDVVFRLAFFEREFKFFTQQQLTSEISAHYTGQALKQLYVLVLGLDVLGNPYGLVVGIKKGVEDLFYEPFQGAIQGPGEFAEGLVLGVKSLFGHTVGGAAGAVSKITGAMGKGLAALTFDEDYQRKRRQTMVKPPKNFQEGIARSGKGLVMGFFDGVTGVVRQPVAGAQKEGVEGFFKGLGKGAIGLVTRPTAGVVDFASGSFDAVKRATENVEEVSRLRPPRFLHQDNILRPYCLFEAEGNKLLREIEKGKYANTDCFVHCEEIVRKHEFLLITNHRVIYVTKNDLFGTWTVQWVHLWHEIKEISTTHAALELILKKEGKKVMGLFSTHEAQRHVILITQQTRREKLKEIMESQLQDT